jgi:hypothetical protein
MHSEGVVTMVGCDKVECINPFVFKKPPVCRVFMLQGEMAEMKTVTTSTALP